MKPHRHVSLYERTMEVMREEKCSWIEARRIMGKRGAAVRQYKATHQPVTDQHKIDESRARMERMGLN